MSNRIQEKVAEYRAIVAEQEREFVQLEAECTELRSELADFEARYNELIKPLMDQLDAAKAAVQSLQELQTKQLFEGTSETVESLWQSSPRIHVKPASPDAESNRNDDDDNLFDNSRRNVVNSKENKLKRLYRHLARRFHPDYARDETDRANRTRLMVLINKAYQERDADALQAIHTEGDVPDAIASPVDSRVSLATLELRQLQKRHRDLTLQIREIKLERSELLYGSMMEMKIKDTLARARGEDMLVKLADDLQAEYWAYMNKLDELKASLK